MFQRLLPLDFKQLLLIENSKFNTFINFNSPFRQLPYHPHWVDDNKTVTLWLFEKGSSFRLVSLLMSRQDAAEEQPAEQPQSDDKKVISATREMRSSASSAPPADSSEALCILMSRDLLKVPEKQPRDDSFSRFSKGRKRRHVLGSQKLVDAITLVDPEMLEAGMLFRGERETYNTSENSCICLGPLNGFRIRMFDFINSKTMENGTLAAIIANSITLAMDIPATKDNDDLQQFLVVSEYLFQTAFTLELLSKVAAIGLVHHDHAYLRSTWNIIDFIVVLAGFSSFIPGMGNFTILRLVRVIRPLRTISRVPGMRTIMNSIIMSLPTLLEVFLLLSFLMIIFAITGVGMFAGKWHQRCHVVNPPDLPRIVLNDSSRPCGRGRACHTNGVILPQECLRGDFKDEILNFDNVVGALLLVFKIIALDDWPEDMHKAQDTVGFVSFIYFVILTIVGAYFCINLVLAILSSVFSDEADAQILDAIQIACLVFNSTDGEEINLIHAIAHNPDGDNPVDDEPQNVLDGNPETKWTDLNLKELVIQFKTPVEIEEYCFVTARDAPQCDPVSWRIEGTHGDDWEVLHEIHDFQTPIERSTPLPMFHLKDKEERFTTSTIKFITLKRRVDAELEAADAAFDRQGPLLVTDPPYTPKQSKDFVGENISVIPHRLSTSTAGSSRHSDELKRRSQTSESLSQQQQSEQPSDTLHADGQNGLDFERVLTAKRSMRSASSFRTRITSDTVSVPVVPAELDALSLFVRHKVFRWFMLLVTVTNVLCLAIDHHDMEKELKNVLDETNFWCTMLFAAECGIKIVALKKEYFKDRYNVFDFILVVVSIPEVILGVVAGSDGGGVGGAMSAFRVFRLTRVARVAQGLEGLRVLLETIVESIISVTYLFLIMLLFIFIFGILGLQLFSGKFDLPPQRAPMDYSAEERSTFESFPQSLLTVFVVITGESWATIMKRGIQGTSWFVGSAYFIVLFVFGNYMLLNLFVAILIYNFSEASRRRAERDVIAMDPEVQPPAVIKDLERLLQDQNKQRKEIVGSNTNEEAKTVPYRSDTAEKKAEPTLSATSSGASFASAVPHPKERSTRTRIGRVGITSPRTGNINPLAPPKSVISFEIKTSSPDENPNETPPTPNDNPPESGNDSTDVDKGPVKSSTDFEGISQPAEEPPLTAIQQSEEQVNDNDTELGSLRIARHHLTSPEDDVVDPFRFGDMGAEGSHCGSPRASSANRYGRGRRRSRCRPNSLKLVAQGEGKPESLIELMRSKLNRPNQVGSQSPSSLAAEYGLKGASLNLFAPTHPFRLLLASIVLHPFFNWAIMIIILLNVVFLAMDDPSLDNDPSRKQMINIGDVVFTVLFTLEAFAKIVTFGGYHKFCNDDDAEVSRGGYLNNVWNRIDLFVCITALAGLGYEPFKLFRSLRAVRLIILSADVRVLVLSLFVALPQIAYVCLVCTFIWLVFAILGVQIFKGTFYYCNDLTIKSRQECNETYSKEVQLWDRIITEEVPREWLRTRYHFDNVGVAMLTLFEVAAGEGWAAIMYTGADTSMDPDVPLERDKNLFLSLYFVVFVIVGGFFAINLFVGMLIEQFGQVKAEKDGSAMLSDAQHIWLGACKVMNRTKLYRNPLIQYESRPLKLISWLVKHRNFDHFIMVNIVLNIGFMCVSHDEQPIEITNMLHTVYVFIILYFNRNNKISKTLTNSNIIFIVIYATEATLKIVGLGLYYF